MKQILQNLKTGVTEVADVPCPEPQRGQLLIRTRRSLVSAGTERMLVDFGKAGWVDKARQQPDKVRQVIDKISTDGLMPTIEAIRNKLDQPLPMGYCNVGTVVEVGAGVREFEVGDRVASNGKHAEFVCVPANLCARVPAVVSDDEAAFTILGAIALQGIRLVQPTLGEAVVVTGLGLIGLVTVQLLKAHGCRVLGIDFDAHKLSLGRTFGAETVDLAAGEDPIARAQSFSRGRGVDAVIVTASTKSSEPMHQAALMCRKRGRIVLVGVVGLELSRADFYEKELMFQVSCSYGPGRYDPNYEERGQDYPVGFVRWTEQRNFEAVLDMMQDGRLDAKALISHRFPIESAVDAYEVVAGLEPSLGILLEYPDPSTPPAFATTITIGGLKDRGRANGAASVGFVGSGNYANAVLIPAFVHAGARMHTIASASGVSSVSAAKKFGFEAATTDSKALLENSDIDTVAIATRHDSHARYVIAAIALDKHVFVEKPLCLTLDELTAIQSAAALTNRILMVGFNRRFAPHITRMKQLLAATPGEKAFLMTVNAGTIPATHWTHDPLVGGGRIVGEGCHFVDLLRFIAGAPITAYDVVSSNATTRDTAVVTLRFADGSIGSIVYMSNGSKAFPKERLEVFASGRVLQLDNFRQMRGFGWPGFSSMNLWRQDKGQRACVDAFINAIRSGGDAPIPMDEIIEVTRISIELQRKLQ